LLKKVKGIKKVYIYGSYAEDKLSAHSDIDLLVIGSHKIIALQKELNSLQKEIDRKINTVNMDKSDFNKRKKRNSFVKGIPENKHIEIKL